MFAKECKGKVFNHKVIEHLAAKFEVSKTAAILKLVKKGNDNHPIFVVCCQDNKMKWLKSQTIGGITHYLKKIHHRQAEV